MTKPKAKVTPQPKAELEISNCSFTGVHWDATAVRVLQTVADTMLEQAMATRVLIEVFKSQNVNVECMLKVEPQKA